MVARANRRRGEVEAMIGGERKILCLTLGALAELETAFAAEDLQALSARFAHGRLRAKDLIKILGAALRGGGNLVADEDVAEMNFENGLSGAAELVVALLTTTFCGPSGGAETEKKF